MFNIKERKDPIAVPEFEIVHSEGDIVLAKYRVKYLYGEKQRSVDYFIKAQFRLQNDKIVNHKDTFNTISQFEFAEMALGFPYQFLALTPFLRIKVKKRAAEKLSQFMKEHGY